MKLNEVFIVTAIVGIIATSVGWADPDGAKQLLESEGFTGVQIKGRTFFGCGKTDIWRTEFSAKNPREIPVHGVICKSVTGEAYIRRK
ncbi:hypothetical protein PA10_00282 [Pseudomonas phage pPa_SNUABM_DT01]|nr:hypothetical protein PA10_00282 [Pseudomonas phage pPa_SNUABM_DT01]